jgi:hypothetical protein
MSRRPFIPYDFLQDPSPSKGLDRLWNFGLFKRLYTSVLGIFPYNSFWIFFSIILEHELPELSDNLGLSCRSNHQGSCHRPIHDSSDD